MTSGLAFGRPSDNHGVRPPRHGPLLVGWALFWLLMFTIAWQDHARRGFTDLWRPLLWEGSSALMASLCVAWLWRQVERADALLQQPVRWFRVVLLQAVWMAPLFVAAIYAVRHAVYRLLGEVYSHEPWPQVFAHEALRFAMFYALFAAVVFGMRSHAAMGAARVRAEQALTLAREAQLLQLAQQMQPHFLFNALNTIAELVHARPAVAEQLLLRLADLLRAAIELARRPLVPLREELALVDAYAAIMRQRFEGRLTVEVEADERALDLQVPSLSLQPLLENAFVHGVERHAGQALVQVRAKWVSAQELSLEVHCNLGAVDAEAADGVGLGNLRQRLEALRGPAASLTLQPRAGGGSVASIHWPVH